MYPLNEQILRLLAVAEHWQRCIPARLDKWDVQKELHRAWWQGEFELGALSADESLRWKALMFMRELPPTSPDSMGVVFYEREDELPPAEVWHGDVLETLDWRWRIRLPVDPARWTEAEVTQACETLAEVQSVDLPDVIQGPLLAMRIDRDLFAAWCDRRKWDRPFFWFAQPRPSNRVKTTLAARTNCRRFLRELVSRAQRLTKGQVKAMTMQRFPQLSTAEFNRLWEQNVPAEWKRPGRPKKQPKRIDSVR